MICKRYPGRRPSDYFDDELSEIDAFMLDGAMALRGQLEDYEHEQRSTYEIKAYLATFIRTQLGKKAKDFPLPDEPQPLWERPKTKEEENYVPTVEEAIKMIGGGVID